jgi:hypothetical protein
MNIIEIYKDSEETVWQSGGCHSWYQDAKGNNTGESMETHPLFWKNFFFDFFCVQKVDLTRKHF